jgi:hypothetical protein
MKWWVPEIVVCWRQWLVGVEYWQGSVMVFVGPVRMRW